MQPTLESNLRRVHARIEAACARAGRDPAGIVLVAVTKSVAALVAADLAGLGQIDLGESRADELERKAAWLAERRRTARWHFVGHLQRNKVRRVLERAATIHSIDSVRLLETVERHAEDLAVEPEVYLEVNFSAEPSASSRTGFAPSELRAAVDRARTLSRVRLAGLMTLAPLVPEPDRLPAAREAFRRLALLAHDLARDPAMRDAFRSGGVKLSMGMSGDFEAAIEAGSDIVRVGAALFAGLEDGLGDELEGGGDDARAGA